MDPRLKDVHNEVCKVQNSWANSAEVTFGYRGTEQLLPTVLVYTILRCVIPVVLSNNNKLMVHMYVVKNTTIFLIVRLLLIRYNYMFRPSVLAIFRLYMKHLTISYIYT